MANKHNWISWDHYLTIHSNRMMSYDYFVILDDLSYESNPAFIRWTGALYCLSDIRIDIEKRLHVERRNGRLFVRTYRYTYHALNTKIHKNLIRYDNFHPHPGHPDAHHKHLYDLPEGHPQESEGRVIHVGEDGWPTLSEFLGEVIARFHTG